jgi:hypothetical protein
MSLPADGTSEEPTALDRAVEADRLRWQLAHSERPDPALVARLAAVWAELASASAEEAARPAPAATQQRVARSAPTARGMRGPGEAPGVSAQPDGIDVTLQLQIQYLPTGCIHVFEPEDDALLVAVIRNAQSGPVRVRVRSWIEGYSASAVDVLELGAGESRSVRQLPTLFPGPLESVREATRATLHVEVDEIGASAGLRLEEQRSFRIWLLPRSTALLQQPDLATGQPRDMSRYLACWVTPNAPDVMECLLRAAARLPAGIGGHVRDPDAVRAQVQAIYETLAETKLAYVNSVQAVGDARAFVQRVRLPAESLRGRAANCLDRTLLFASLLEAASLRPALVVLPGHALLAWNGGAGAWEHLETTVSSVQPFASACEIASRQLQVLAGRPDVTPRYVDVAAERRRGLVPLE